MKTKKIIITFISFLIIPLLAFADLPEEMVKKQVTSINLSLQKENYKEAYEKSNVLLRSFSTPVVFPANVTYITTQAYDKYISLVEKNADYDAVDEIDNNLQIFTGIANAKLQLRVLKLRADSAKAKEYELEKMAKEAAAELKDNPEKALDTAPAASRKNSSKANYFSTELLLAVEQQNKKAVAALEKVVELNEKMISEGDETNKKNTDSLDSIVKWVTLAFVGIAILTVLIFFALVLIVVFARKNKYRNMQFDETLRMIAGMQQQSNQILLGGITDLSNLNGLRYAGSSGWGSDALPAPEMTEEEKSELKQLAIDCENLGSEIDALTRRKNNSKNVSELVYKLAVKLGLNQNTAMVYFCAAMVYDAGFKDLPSVLWESENLTEEQRNQLKEHVQLFEKHLGFVPKKYWQIFEEAAKYHHENTDGSGYPEGIKNDEIPQIARLIHVAESYNSLISRRNYKQIQDKESAIAELSSEPGLYDAEVVRVLDSIL